MINERKSYGKVLRQRHGNIPLGIPAVAKEIIFRNFAGTVAEKFIRFGFNKAE